jgi:hypothetical protein
VEIQLLGFKLLSEKPLNRDKCDAGGSGKCYLATQLLLYPVVDEVFGVRSLFSASTYQPFFLRGVEAYIRDLQGAKISKESQPEHS